MTQWQEIRRRPVLPLYLAALVWLAGALLLPLYELWAVVVTAVASAAVGLAAARLCPTRVVRRRVPFTTGQEDADRVLEAIRLHVDALHTLNQEIPDPVLSREMDRMETAGRAIAEEVARDPAKAPQVDRFARYYLPEAVKILSAYARAQGRTGENAAQIRREVCGTAAMIAQAFENQLDSLYASEALDISTDIDVLENILQSQNLAGEDTPPTP